MLKKKKKILWKNNFEKKNWTKIVEKKLLSGKRTNGGTRSNSGTNRVLKRNGDMILYGYSAIGTVSLSVPSLVRLP